MLANDRKDEDTKMHTTIASSSSLMLFSPGLDPSFALGLRQGLALQASSGVPLSRLVAEKDELESRQRWQSAVQLIGDPRAKFGDRPFNPGRPVMEAALNAGLVRGEAGATLRI